MLEFSRTTPEFLRVTTTDRMPAWFAGQHVDGEKVANAIASAFDIPLSSLEPISF